ncbi:TonB-dependent receptor [Luteimonas aquatica]|uniref:TonB-dependent receptor n=1 Tax=Luteimonas aquatica TaxID=450364 RepID=UPI001F580ABC|nr:TonB-dependent receptor [Luteimonas aquatica]
MSSNKPNPRKRALCMAMGLCLVSLTTMPVMAQNTTGSIVGRAEPGSQVTIVNPQTGYTRTVTADSQGNYRLALLPTGGYTLQTSKDGVPVGDAVPVTVTLGNATTVNIGSAGTTNLDVVQVKGSRVINAVDVTSTESATNVTREEIARLPVDQSVGSVALLAPGVVQGKSSLGAQGLSFGGSSVAENTVYINGLNVTDFYNRVGYSSVPFAFYQEFQVKTGGYSVEFGRSTGGVINAVTRSGSNEFKSGVELTFEPRAWQSAAKNRYLRGGGRYIAADQDDYTRAKFNAYASGPIIKDRLFFFAMYEARDYRPRSTNDAGSVFNSGQANDPFWGGKLDWQITDRHSLSLFGFSDKNNTVTDVYDYDFDSGVREGQTNQLVQDNGGKNWAATYTGNFTDNFSMKALYGENDRERSASSANDVECNRVFDNRSLDDGVPEDLQGDRGCTTATEVVTATDKRKAARLDFEWSLGSHLFRFGADREENTSEQDRYYPGPGRIRYDVYRRTPGAPLNGGRVPASGLVVRTRQNEVQGSFKSINSALYIEDNWSVTENLLLNIGLRKEAFDNQDSDGRSYIEMDDMYAPRFGFSWDMKGDGATKVFGNLGRYFLPVANVINIKQAGAFLDERRWYEFLGYQDLLSSSYGRAYALPILGGQIGGIDNSQGDGTVGDLRSEVDRDMDPVYQDELILGFQTMINEKWSWGASATYRKLNNAIDDMEISATGACGEDGYVGFVMANPGKKVTVWGDTDCNGSADGWITVDTAREGWAMYRQDGVDGDGDPIMTYIGQRGWGKPKRSYAALELQIDRAWDEKWGFNASYTLSYNKGNAEGPVNSDTDFADTGRTENFDNPWVNYRGSGYLANDHRHQFKFRGSYAVTENLTAAASLNVQSGAPITAFGAGNPFDTTDFHSYYICVENCNSTYSNERVYVHSRRGGEGRTPWVYNLDLSLAYKVPIPTDLRIKFAIYNVLNQQRTLGVDQDLQPQDSIGTFNPMYGYGQSFQSPRYAQLVVSWNF